MIGGEDRQIAGRQRRQEPARDAVEPFQLRGIAGNVPPVAEIGVELDEVRECQAAGFGLGAEPDQVFGQGRVIFALVQAGDAAMAEDVADLADGMGDPPRTLRDVQDGVARRRDREIAAVAGATERAGLADKGARDYPAHAHRVQHR